VFGRLGRLAAAGGSVGPAIASGEVLVFVRHPGGEPAAVALDGMTAGSMRRVQEAPRWTILAAEARGLDLKSITIVAPFDELPRQ
jgi:hypothetical protein